MEGKGNTAKKAVQAAAAHSTAFGASTICAASFCNSEVLVPKMSFASLGDSGFVVLRKSVGTRRSVVVESVQQQHQWNCPYQLARLPPSLVHSQGQPIKYDGPEDCDLFETTVQAGDLILLFTDGFSDNVSQEKLLDLIEIIEGGVLEVDPESLAQELAGIAHDISLDRGACVPFHESAREAGVFVKGGGKEDDITVLAAQVMFGSESEYSRLGVTSGKGCARHEHNYP